jgi:hypothetical protein
VHEPVDHEIDLVEIFFTPSASSPSQGTTRTSPEIDLCAPSPEKARRNPNPPVSLSQIYSRSFDLDPTDEKDSLK